MTPELAWGVLLVVLPTGLALGLAPFLIVYLRWRAGDPEPWALHPDYDARLREIYAEQIARLSR